MSKKGKILLVVIAITLVFIIVRFAGMIAPGSYPYAERYEIEMPEDSLIQLIETFKSENPEYIVPPEAQLKDGRSGDSDYWYHIYFYYREKNQIVHTWVRASEKHSTTFAFDAVNDGLVLGRWKTVNDDFGFFENRKVKKEFEDRILENVKRISVK